MMIETIVSMARYLSARQDDDLVDRMNYLYTPNALLAFSVLISFKQFGGRPLECMFPNKFPGSWEQAMEPTNMEEKTCQITIEKLTRHLGRALRFQRNISKRNIIVYKTFKFLNVSYSTCFISFAYLFTKLLYLVNVVMQLYLMNRFLETNKYEWYGLDVIRDVIQGVPWQASGYFPRVSLCDFTVRQVANIQRYTVQCVLIINIFNEKIFILLWFWYTLLTACTLLSILFWMILMVFPCFARNFVSSNLELNENFDFSKNKKRINKFVNEYLKQDGVFVLRMIGMHAGVLFTSELTMHLFEMYFEYDAQAKAAKKHKNGKTVGSDAERGQQYANNISESLKKRSNKKLSKKLEAVGAVADAGVALIPIMDAGNQSTSSFDTDESNPATGKRRERNNGKDSDSD